MWYYVRIWKINYYYFKTFVQGCRIKNRIMTKEEKNVLRSFLKYKQDFYKIKLAQAKYYH